jgi:hypothetical protein
MSRETLLKIPGRKDIDDQFKSGNIHRTQGLLKALLKSGNGNYKFGALTAAYNNWPPGSPDYVTWMKDADSYPPEARDPIKNCIIEAMTGKDAPIPVMITWTQSADRDVKVSQGPSGYTIEIIGYPAPPNSGLDERGEKKY